MPASHSCRQNRYTSHHQTWAPALSAPLETITFLLTWNQDHMSKGCLYKSTYIKAIERPGVLAEMSWAKKDARPSNMSKAIKASQTRIYIPSLQSITELLIFFFCTNKTWLVPKNTCVSDFLAKQKSNMGPISAVCIILLRGNCWQSYSWYIITEHTASLAEFLWVFGSVPDCLSVKLVVARADGLTRARLSPCYVFQPWLRGRRSD